MKRDAHYAGISLPTCRKYARRVRSDKREVDTFDRDLIRRTVFEMIEIPTATAIMKHLKAKL